MNYNINYIKIIEDIPFFSEDRYWGKTSKEELEKALAVIEEKGWREFETRYRGKFDFTFEENRADWRFDIPINKDFVILESGAGMGRTTIPLARIARKVVAFDTSFLRMKFLKKRAEKEGLKNIEVFVGDIFNLPLSDNSFDVVSMNGVLEWVGKTDKFKNPREAQVEALKICRKLLKKDGYLYVGIENRFALAYLRGVDHGGLRYTSYMPRFSANIYSKLRGKGPYNTYTYSKDGYEKLLNDAGFDSYKFYLPYPGYNLPRIVIPYASLNILRYVIKVLMPNTGITARIVKFLSNFRLLLWFYRKFFFSFNIIVKK